MNKFLSNKVYCITNGMDKVIKSKNFGRAITIAQVMFFTVLLSTKIAFAEADFSTLTSLIALWTGRVGGVIAFVGAFLFAMGWRGDDPGEMIKGGKTCIAGIMVIAIAKGASAWMG